MVWTPVNPGRVLKNIAALTSIAAELEEEARRTDDGELAERAREALQLVERLAEHPSAKACPEPDREA
jgi:hypothetical protein